MKSLLFALGLALCCFVQANQDTPFEKSDLSKIEGSSYFVAIRTNCEKMKKMMTGMPASHVNFKIVSENEVQMTIEMRTREGCKTMTIPFKREGANGPYTGTCGHGVKKTIENTYSDGKVMFNSIIVSHKEGQCKVATLSVRSLDKTQAAIADFDAFADRNGLKAKETHILPTEGMCPRSS